MGWARISDGCVCKCVCVCAPVCVCVCLCVSVCVCACVRVYLPKVPSATCSRSSTCSAQISDEGVCVCVRGCAFEGASSATADMCAIFRCPEKFLKSQRSNHFIKRFWCEQYFWEFRICAPNSKCRHSAPNKKISKGSSIAIIHMLHLVVSWLFEIFKLGTLFHTRHQLNGQNFSKVSPVAILYSIYAVS